MRYLNILLVCLMLTGCGEPPQIRQYTVPREEEKLVTTEVLRKQFSVIPFRWKVPSDWRAADNDQFSKLAWTAGPESPSEQARITVSDLPASAGLNAQVERWAGQVKLGTDEAKKALQSLERLPLGDNSSGAWIELRGEKETIYGMLVSESETLWVIKYRSPNATAEKQRALFRGFCESLKLEKSGRS